MNPRVAITGANGFLGRALTRRLLTSGAEVCALSRQPVTESPAAWHAYDLAQNGPVNLPPVDTVVHAAFAMGSGGTALERLNETAALRLRDAARAQGAHFIFISSMSAHAAAVSSYGRAKWRIEQSLDQSVDTIVRPGLVIGPGGVYARMLTSVRAAPCLPLFYGGRQPLQPITIDDLVEALQRIIAQRITGSYNLGQPHPLTIREFYQYIMATHGWHRPLIPIPGDLSLACLRLTEKLGIRLPLTAENLLGQKHLRVFETAPSLRRLDLALKPLTALPRVGEPDHTLS